MTTELRKLSGVWYENRPNKEEGCESPTNPSLYLGDCRFKMPLSNREGETVRPMSQKTCLI